MEKLPFYEKSKRRKEGELLGDKKDNEDGDEKNEHTGTGLIILQVADVLKEDRWRPAKALLDKMNAKRSDVLMWIKIDKKHARLFPLNRDLFSHIDITEMQERELYQILKDSIPDIEKSEDDHLIAQFGEDEHLMQILNDEIDNCACLLQVKSQGRVGSKKQFQKLFEVLNLEKKDILAFKIETVLDEDREISGWNITYIKYADILSSEKMIVKGKIKE